jgi:GTP cyclohydrolase I
MADYVNADEDRGKDVTHYPNDGHPQCVKSYASMTLEEQQADYARRSRNDMPLIPSMKLPARQSLFVAKEAVYDQSEQAAQEFLRSLGVNLDKEHHRETPRRLAEAMKELTIREEFKFTTFEAKSQNMITLGPIPFYTLCAHHTLPFHGNAWIGYVPDEKIAGLSKFARAVGYVSKGFHVQEELTTELHEFLNSRLQPKGLAVVMKAEHMCMAMRGVRTAGVITTTSEVSGVFADHTRTAKAEFLEWIRNG